MILRCYVHILLILFRAKCIKADLRMVKTRDGIVNTNIICIPIVPLNYKAWIFTKTTNFFENATRNNTSICYAYIFDSNLYFDLYWVSQKGWKLIVKFNNFSEFPTSITIVLFHVKFLINIHTGNNYLIQMQK